MTRIFHKNSTSTKNNHFLDLFVFTHVVQNFCRNLKYQDNIWYRTIVVTYNDQKVADPESNIILKSYSGITSLYSKPVCQLIET